MSLYDRCATKLPPCAHLDRACQYATDSLKESRTTRFKFPVRLQIHRGKSSNSVLIENRGIGGGNVVEIAIKHGMAKVIGFYNDMDDAAAESFTAEEITLHVSVD